MNRDKSHEFAMKKVDDFEQRNPHMSDKSQFDAEQLRKIREDILDSIDEELEMAIDDGENENDPLASPEERQARVSYFRELLRLQGELVKLQDWVVATKGEIVLFDRSWYNRAGVERVMGFCTDDEYEEFFRSVPEFEKMLGRSGITLLKYWFSITDDEQHARFLGRIHDPLKQWKLSPMDLESRRRWEDYTRAKETMIERTHIPEAPWWVVQAVDKKRARLNCIDHLLGQFNYHEVEHAEIALPARVRNPDYIRNPVPSEMVVPEKY